MSERYSKLYALPENLYISGAPVLISAGALLKDSQSGKILAQLKLRNLQESTLTACKISIKAFDPSGTELKGIDEFSYLDLKVERGKDFGAKTPVYLPNDTTRKFSAAVIQAVYADGTVWNNPFEEWKPVFTNCPKIQEKLTDTELQKQYSLEIGKKCIFTPETDGDLFLCTCGKINSAKSKTCAKCGLTLADELSKLDTEYLTQKKDERLEQEKAEQERRNAEMERLQAERKRKLKKASVPAAIAVAIIILILIITQVIVPNIKYNNAEKLMSESNYDEAIAVFEALGDFKDSADRIKDAKYKQAALYENAKQYSKAMELYSELEDYKDSKDKYSTSNRIVAITASPSHTVVLKANGTVVATGINRSGQCNVSDWRDIIAISAGNSNTVGLKADGTVVAVGGNNDGQCNVSDWTDIIAVSAGYWHTVGLRSDGTVIAVGDNYDGQCDVSDWTDIIAVSAGSSYTVGLKSDGTVVAVGNNNYDCCNVSDWTDIIAVSAGQYCTIGLKADGSVIAVGDNSVHQCGVSDWQDIIAIDTCYDNTIGLKSDGTVIATHDNYNGSYIDIYYIDGYKYGGYYTKVKYDISEWNNIVAICAGDDWIVGLQSDGTIVAIGDNRYGQCNVDKLLN